MKRCHRKIKLHPPKPKRFKHRVIWTEGNNQYNLTVKKAIEWLAQNQIVCSTGTHRAEYDGGRFMIRFQDEDDINFFLLTFGTDEWKKL